MNHKNTVKKLKRLAACDEAMDWVRENGGDMATLWATCPRGDWMAWYIGETKALRHKPEHFKALAEVAAKVLKTVGGGTNEELYRDILKEFRACIQTGQQSEKLDNLRRELVERSYDSAREDTFRELAEAISVPHGTYAFFIWAASAMAQGDIDKKERELKKSAKTLRKYFEVGERGLQVKE